MRYVIQLLITATVPLVVSGKGDGALSSRSDVVALIAGVEAQVSDIMVSYTSIMGSYTGPVAGRSFVRGDHYTAGKWRIKGFGSPYRYSEWVWGELDASGQRLPRSGYRAGTTEDRHTNLFVGEFDLRRKSFRSRQGIISTEPAVYLRDPWAGPGVLSFGMFGKPLSHIIATAETATSQKTEYRGAERLLLEIVHLADPVRYRVWLSVDKGWVPVRTERYDGDGNLICEVIVEKLTRVADFLWSPKEAVTHQMATGKDGQRKVVQSMRFSVESVQVNTGLEEEDFLVQWPPGPLSITDEVLHKKYRIQVPTDRVTDKDLISPVLALAAELAQRPETDAEAAGRAEAGPAGDPNTGVVGDAAISEPQSHLPVIAAAGLALVGIAVILVITLLRRRGGQRSVASNDAGRPEG